MHNTTETIDKLFLELSQFTQAKTRRELDLEATLQEIRKELVNPNEPILDHVRCLNLIDSVLSK